MALGRCQYARNSISASSKASFPIVVGTVFKRPVLRRSVRIERAEEIMLAKMSSKKRLRKVRASVWSLSGRKSDKIASAECGEMYMGICKWTDRRERRKVGYSLWAVSCPWIINSYFYFRALSHTIPTIALPPIHSPTRCHSMAFPPSQSSHCPRKTPPSHPLCPAHRKLG